MFLVDIRLFFHGLKQRSINYFERLWTKWYIIPNAQYEQLWLRCRNMTDDLIISNRLATADSLKFYVEFEIDRITNNFFNYRKEAAMKIGYDYKVLTYALRYYFLAEILLANKPFSEYIAGIEWPLTKAAKLHKFTPRSVRWLERFLYEDFNRIYYDIYHTYTIDDTLNNKLIDELDQMKKEVLNDYYGSSAGAL